MQFTIEVADLECLFIRYNQQIVGATKKSDGLGLLWLQSSIECGE
jgi:hypothetical protein